MHYTNDKIEQLREERDALLQKYDSKIQREVEKEKAKYKFSWKRFSMLIGVTVFLFLAIEMNKKIFPKTSIWSWEYYIGDSK